MVFDEIAWEMAQNVSLYGWEELKWFGSPLAAGNVIVLASLYVIFGHDPSLVIPINAAMHAFGGVLIFMLAKMLATNKKVGLYSGIIAGTLFVVFPSALNWYGQVHKDGYAILGTLLILLMWGKAVDKPIDNTSWMVMLFASTIGIIFVGFVRPYGLTLLFVVGIGALLIVLVSESKKISALSIKKVMFFMVTLVLLLIATFMVKEGTKQVVPESEVQYEIVFSDGLVWAWEENDWFPKRLENYVYTAARTRAGSIMQGQKINAQSIMDPEVSPKSITEVMEYLPRAFQLATLAPFPESWVSNLNVTRLLAAGEMFIFYLCLPGLFLLLLYNRSPKVWLAVYFASAFLVIFGFTIANLGSLYRVRYAYIQILLMLGVLGWVTFLERKKVLEKLSSFLKPAEGVISELAQPVKVVKSSRKKAVSSAFYVMLLTLFGFIGFFYRDILMAHTFGLGIELDAFFISLLIPMTIVTILCIPLGAAFTPFFINLVQTNGTEFTQGVISRLSTIIFISLALICAALYFSLPLFVSYAGNNDPARIQQLILLALPILLFSGIVILANTILNAMGKVIVSGTAQLIVPLIAIIAVVFFGESRGIEAGIIGMVVGQLFNLVLLERSLKKYGYSVLPRFGRQAEFSFGELVK